MNITILGSSGKQTVVRECVSLLIETDGIAILFDAGPGVVTSLYRANRNLTDIDTMVLTHVHGDHILGFAYFIYNRVVEYKSMGITNDKPLGIIGDNQTLLFAKDMLDRAYPGMNIPFKLFFEDISTRKRITIGNSCSLAFYDAIHAVPTLSTIISTDKHKVVYTSDTLPNECLIDPANGADVIIHEAMYLNSCFSKSRRSKHATALDAGTIANKIHARQLIMVHIAPDLLGKEHEMLNEAAQVFDGIISIPYDGTVYHV